MKPAGEGATGGKAGRNGPPRKSLVAHYHGSQLRQDTWKRLEHDLRVLASVEGGDREDLRERVASCLETLRSIESYWAFPGRRVFRELVRMFEAGETKALARRVARIERLLVSEAYRRRVVSFHETEGREGARRADLEEEEAGARTESRPYFEVLFVGSLSEEEEEEIRSRMLEMRREEDETIYDIVFVPSFEDALIAVLFNYNIQSCVLRYSFPVRSRNPVEVLREYLGVLQGGGEPRADADGNIGVSLGNRIRVLRPELDLYLVTDAPVEDVAVLIGRSFRRIFYRSEDYRELHLSILKGINERYDTPFFSALKTYSQKPTGVFHALPISRGKSIAKSHWILDMGKFYGENIFMAETSATGGGLDSLLQPHGPLKSAQVKAARAFGARQTWFVTNGTSTANKIVTQALLRPGDIVLVSRDCHKSHHYAVILAGGNPVYLDAYPLHEFSMYGAIPLASLKRALLDLRREGKLDRVKMVMLTNCTFDGMVYDPERVMMELLAIKPDLVFLWDEAWFAFARFLPTYRNRTAMESCRRLKERFRSPEYRERYAAWRKGFEPREGDDDAWMEGPLLPDPGRVRVRAYSTQSTHKTLTSLRQGSMIHVFDQDFGHGVADAFQEAYMTHTSTSPNYQILASLDVGRRQVELEGYEFVKRSLELAMILRERISSSPLLRRYFRVLGAKDMIPGTFRPSGFEYYFHAEGGWTSMEEAWSGDEFVLDPTRITLHIGGTGMDGDTFKRKLIEEYDIQINKTSRNTVLFMVHIGTTRGTVAYLISVLTRIAEELDERREQFSAIEEQRFRERVSSLTENLPPLPNFSRFHAAFRPDPRGTTPEGDMRSAFFRSYDEERCRFLKLDGSILRELETGNEVVSAAFVIPYPPGFPVLVPGQVISKEILAYLRALDVKEIHGYNPEHGLKVFTEEAAGAPPEAGGAEAGEGGRRRPRVAGRSEA